MDRKPEEIAALLQGLRLERGWSLHRAVTELHKAAEASGYVVGADKYMLSKWENGKKQPSQQYRWLLAKVYEVPPAVLGSSAEPPSSRPGMRLRSRPRSTWTKERTRCSAELCSATPSD